jgi:heat shock protein HslJ
VLPRALGSEGDLPLEGPSWRLASYRRGDELRPSGPEVAAWLTLRDGRIRGSGGCRPLRGRYGRMGEAITIRLQGPGRATCAEQTVLVDRGIRQGLSHAASATVIETADGAQLLVSDADDMELLLFVPDDAATLEPGEWRLVRAVVADTAVEADDSLPAVLTFRSSSRSVAERRSSGELVGSSGCNGFIGGYARSGSVLDVAGLQWADAPCPPGLAAQEAAIKAVLGSEAMRIDLPVDGLILTDIQTGDRLEYEAATPLEGSAWRSQGLAAHSARGEPITLRLEDGVVSGWGPCGSYGGEYVTDGRFITIRNLAGPGSCPAARRQRRYFADLAAAVLVERVGTGLRLLDARGRVVARFRPPAAGP